MFPRKKKSIATKRDEGWIDFNLSRSGPILLFSTATGPPVGRVVTGTERHVCKLEAFYTIRYV